MARINGSFRDPAGYVYTENGIVLRAVNHVYQAEFDHLLVSGLYDALIKKRLMVPFDVVSTRVEAAETVYKTIQPAQINFISYPYEWSFSMLQDAALLTLEIQEIALKYGMSLKDASAYNVQFQNGKPIFIDTLSFEFYKEGLSWIAYRQFCQHFLAPLFLMTGNPSIIRLLSVYIDGIPLEMVRKMLPLREKMSLGYFMHIRLHAATQLKYQDSDKQLTAVAKSFSLQSFRHLLHNLKQTTAQLKISLSRSEWNNYEHEDTHASEYTAQKTAFITTAVETSSPTTVWDLGANTGLYSKIAATKAAEVIAFDGDPLCIEMLYTRFRKTPQTNILPLFLDLANPSPALGWAHTERGAWADRQAPDLVLALALVHHLTISNQIPFAKIAALFATLTTWLVIEFVPRTDPKVEKLLRNRRDTAEHYSQEAFETAFFTLFDVIQTQVLPPSGRIIFLMKKKKEL